MVFDVDWFVVVFDVFIVCYDILCMSVMLDEVVLL